MMEYISRGKFWTGLWTLVIKRRQKEKKNDSPNAWFIMSSQWISAEQKWLPNPHRAYLSKLFATLLMIILMTTVKAKSNKPLRKSLLIEKTRDFRGINITVRPCLLSIPFNFAFCFNLQTAMQIEAAEGRHRKQITSEELCVGARVKMLGR